MLRCFHSGAHEKKKRKRPPSAKRGAKPNRILLSPLCVRFSSKMALELSKQACRMCNGEYAYALQALLDAHPGIDLYLFEREGCYNIMGEAALHKSPECLQVLLDFKADVNSQDRGTGSTPLHAAAGYDRVDTIHLLLKKNADVTIADHNGQTALSLAASRGQLGCLKLMIDAKADVDHQTNNGVTCLYSACQGGACRVCAPTY
jgi:ankyrin repeat protein